MWLFVLLIYEISLLLVFSVFFFTWCVKLTVLCFFNTFALSCFRFSMDIQFSTEYSIFITEYGIYLIL